MMGWGLRAKIDRFKFKAKAKFHNTFLRPNLYNMSQSERLGAIYMLPSDMCVTDRILLYALIRGLRPERILEIGVRWGGGARIVSSALEDNGKGRAVGIDPEPLAFAVEPSHLFGRYTRVEGYSPCDTPKAIEALGGPPDVVIIDALHTGDAVHADFLGVLEHLGDEAHIIFHDAYHQGVSSAITEVVQGNSSLFDLGFLSRAPDCSFPVSYQGIRVVRKGAVNHEMLIAASYSEKGLAAPIFHPALRNFDEFANRIGQGADPKEIVEIFPELT